MHSKKVNMKERWKKLEQKLKEKKVDAFLFTHSPNIFYFSGSWVKGALLYTPGEKFFITPLMYKEQIKREGGIWKKVIYEDGLENGLESLNSKIDIKKCGFESNHLSFAVYKKIKEKFKPRLIPCRGAGEEIRAIKDKPEIEFITKAAEITIDAFGYLREILHNGVTEKEIAREAINYILEEADEISFYPIVLFGERTSLPHGRPTDQELKENELVLIDIGAKVGGYCADITRTFVWGRISEKWKKIYDFVKTVKQTAIQYIKPGVKSSEVNEVIREEGIRAGYPEGFLHGAGHGVGLEVHEEPILNRSSNTLLEEGMVVSLEPGIYSPGEGGVRMEDMILITNKGGCILP